MKVILREGQQIGPNKNIEEWQIEGCHYSGDNVTALVTKSVTKTVTALSPKQGHTKETITKEKRNNKNTMSESVRTECEKSPDRHEETDKAFEEIFWCAGMRKAGKKNAASAFRTQFREWRKTVRIRQVVTIELPERSALERREARNYSTTIQTIIRNHRIENWLRVFRQVNHEIKNQIATGRWL